MKQNVTVVILAAGLGTRMKSKKAKVLHEAGGDTLLNHVIRAALPLAPPEKIIAVIGHQADEVRASVRRQASDLLSRNSRRVPAMPWPPAVIWQLPLAGC